jgi:hypothetical protein
MWKLLRQRLNEGWWLVAHGHEDDMMYGMHSLAACEV